MPDQVRFDFAHRFDQYLRRGYFTQQGDVSTGGQCSQEVERTAECVGQWEERDDPASFEVQFGLHAEEYVSGQVVYREHDSLAESGRTRSVADDRYAVVIDFRVGDLFGGESPRITAAVAFADLALEAGQRIAVAVRRGNGSR